MSSVLHASEWCPFSLWLSNKFEYCYWLEYIFLFSLQPIPILENKTGPGTIEFLSKRLLAIGAVQTGGFLVDCETFHSVPQMGEYLSFSVLIWISLIEYDDFKRRLHRHTLWGYVDALFLLVSRLHLHFVLTSNASFSL